MNKILKFVGCLLIISLNACNNNGGGNSSSESFKIGGVVKNLISGNSLILQDNNDNPITIMNNGQFEFSQLIPQGGSYKVTVVTQPLGQYCSVVNGGGSNIDANITNVTVYCSSQTATIGGRVKTLDSGTSVELSLFRDGNLVGNLVQNKTESFTFTESIPLYSSYTVKAFPSSSAEKCTVTNGSGIAMTNMNNVYVTCSSKVLTVSGNVTAIKIPFGAAITFNNIDSGESFTVKIKNAFNNPFSFTLPYGGSYYLTTSASNLSCSITPNKVTNIISNMNNVSIQCAAPITISGNVLNLPTDSSISIENTYTSKSVVVFSNDPTFSLQVPYNSGYNIQVIAAPDGYNCDNITNGYHPSGVTSNQTVTITCKQRYFVLHSFIGGITDGVQPNGALARGNDGDFYGTTASGGDGNQGTIFKITPEGHETLLYSFKGGNSDGAQPKVGLVLATDGKFYGTTTSGGGTIYKFDPLTNTESPIYFFSSQGYGAYGPAGELTQYGTDLYGVTTLGGQNSVGVIYKININSEIYLPVYSFKNNFQIGNDGNLPYSGLIKASNGNLYGTTSFGGDNDYGTIYQFNPQDNIEHKIYSFQGGDDGGAPTITLLQATDGNLYGTNINGGISNNGLVFQMLLLQDTFSIFYKFDSEDNQGDGIYPNGGLMQVGQNLFGITQSGGTFGYGTIYQVSVSSAAESTLYSFRTVNEVGISGPVGKLASDTKGNLYGVTQFDGGSKFGTIYKYVTQ